MRLGVVSGPRYYRAGKQYYTYTSYHAEMWKECLYVFDEVILVDRVVYQDKVGPGQKPVVIDGIRFIEYPNFKGFYSLLKALPTMFMCAKKTARQADVWHLSAPSFGSFCMWFWIWFYRIPYSVELRGEQSMNPVYLRLRGIKLVKVIALIMRMSLHLQLSRPIMIVAVGQYLIEKYKPRNNCPGYVISDNRIPTNMYLSPREWSDTATTRAIISVGYLEVVKNPSGLLRACALLNQKVSNWRLQWIGEGPLIQDMQNLAAELGITEKVQFCGFVPWGPQLFEKLYAADLFVLNSLSEGLPRAMLEAMSCGLPVIGTNVGGIPELLPNEDIVPILEDNTLADKLYEVLSDENRLKEMSRRNLQTAKNYSTEILSAKKIEFYRQLKKRVEELKRQNPFFHEMANKK